MNPERKLVELGRAIEEKLETYRELTAQLRQVELQKALLDAELRGLEAQRDALAANLQGISSETRRPAGEATVTRSDLTKRSLVDAIVDVLNATDEELRVDDVCDQLEQRGRNDNRGSVSVTLSYLEKNEKIERVTRGVYRGRREGK